MSREHTTHDLIEAARHAFASGAVEYDGPEGWAVLVGHDLPEPEPAGEPEAEPPFKASFTRRPSLAEAQEWVGGLVEVVQIARSADLLINEEGRLIGLPLNHTASKLAGMAIAGPAWLLVGKARWI
jgi:hypothetical protein